MGRGVVDDYTNAQLTEAEVDAEIEKALAFEPSLMLLVFATTANKDAKIEGYIRKKDIENRSNGLFNVDIASWEDIVDLMERYRETYNWYVNNCQFKDATDVCVTFDGEDEVTIHPEFVKLTTHYEYRALSPLEQAMMNQLGPIKINPMPSFMTPWNQLVKIDKRWCDLDICIVNVGSTVIKNSKLILHFRSEDIIKIDDNFHYCNDFLINDVVRAQINTGRDARREVFKIYKNEIEYRSKETVFVQTDERKFSISLKPADGKTEIPLFWKFLCEDFQKEGALVINVEPEIEEKTEVVTVYNEDDLKPDEVKILPKIIEE